MEQTIINSSPLTQEWISILINAVLEKNSDVEFRNTKYWVIVENKTTNRKIACLNPPSVQWIDLKRWEKVIIMKD